MADSPPTRVEKSFVSDVLHAGWSENSDVESGHKDS